MLDRTTQPDANATALRLGAATLGTLTLLLAVLALVRPEIRMMGMDLLHRMASMMGG